MGGTVAAFQVVAERGNKFEGGANVGGKCGLRGDPSLGVVQGLVNPSTLDGSALHDPAVDEEEEHGHPARQGGPGPVGRTAQVVLQVHSGIADGLFHERFEVLVVAVSPVRGEAVGPLAREVTDG